MRSPKWGNKMPNMTREEAKLCVGKGWSCLIDEIFDRLPEDAFILQIKEKFGGLRFCVSGISIEVGKFIDSVEDRSHTICERCGSPGKIREGGWILTLCDKCHVKRKT
jgi:hypothetical protein